MRAGLVISILAILLWLAPSAPAAVMVEDLSMPTLDTLTGFGADGVIAGGVRYFNVSYWALGTGRPTIPAINVESIGDGLRFTSDIRVSGGQGVGVWISYVAAPVDSSMRIAGIDLFSDGAVVSGTGTSIGITETARDSSGTVMGRKLTTFNDGMSGPPDLTLADQNFDSDAFAGVSELHIEHLFVLRSLPASSGGGVARLRMVEASVVLIPEPSCATTAIGTLGVVMWRRRRYKGSIDAHGPSRCASEFLRPNGVTSAS